MDNRDRTLWVGNLSDRTKEEILYELFLQVSKMKISNMNNHNIDKVIAFSSRQFCSFRYMFNV